MIVQSNREKLEIRANQNISPGGHPDPRNRENFTKKYDMDTNNCLTASERALDMRNHSLWIPTINPMLRLVPQLRRSSEIQLFEDTVCRQWLPEKKSGTQAWVAWLGSRSWMVKITGKNREKNRNFR